MGLTEKEAAERLKADGKNQLEEGKKTGAAAIFIGQFRDVMVMILLAATGVSVLLGEISDAVTIILIVLLNAILGFIQEFRTEHTLEALRSMTAPTAKCYRDGELTVIDAAGLVCEDVIELEAGDRVPADCVILRAAGLFADEAMLTGESEAVAKSAGTAGDTDNSLNKSSIVYCGTSVTKGTCTAKVIAVGKRTQMGRISEMLTDIDRELTPLQKRLAELGKAVAVICIVVCAAVFAAGVLRGEEVFSMLMTGITIAIAAIPEGLPATVTIALALAVSRMLKQKALVNKLHSVETLGCASVICSDKTGTITENKMTVTELAAADECYYFSGMGYRISGGVTKGDEGLAVNPVNEKALTEALICGVICSDASITAPSGTKNRNRGAVTGKGEWKVSGDPTEAALLIAGAKAGVTRDSLGTERRRLEEFPFDSENRFMAVHCAFRSGKRTYFKGAEEVLLPRCSQYMSEKGEIFPMTTEVRRRISAKTLEMSDKALRVLALAYCDADELDPHRGNLVFLGLAGMIDPPREEAKLAIRKCANASVKTVMITGDHKNTAVAVAKKAGLLRAADECYYFSGMGYRISGGVTKGDEGLAVNPVNEKALTEALICGVICSDASITAPSGTKNRNRGAVTGKGEWKVSGDPTEAALLIAGAKAGVTRDSLGTERRRLEEFPFDSENRFMAVHCAFRSGKRTYFKGAEEVLLPRCSQYMSEKGEIFPMTTEVRRRISAKTLEMSDKALRVLALAYCDADELDPHRGNLVFLGLAGMIDPPREEAKLAIRKCANASVKTVMITGDHKNTAVAVAKKAGLLRGGKAMTGEELDKLSDEELDRVISKYTVFARVEPAHKLRIVRSFKRRGEIVTMTGDGVNDAPAIKEADVGVAMGVTGTDVTKQAADVILLDDNLATLVNAVEQGRCVYANIRKFVRYLLSCNIGEVLTMFLGILMGMPMILLPVQILLVNLVTDGLPAVALGMDPPEKDIMSRPPRRSSEGFFSGGLMGKIVFRGIFIGLCTLASFALSLRLGGTVEAARTCALITLVMSQLIHVFECRSESRSIFRIDPFGNIKLLLAAAVSVGVLAAAVAVPQLQVVFETVIPEREQLLAALGLSAAVPIISGFFK